MSSLCLARVDPGSERGLHGQISLCCVLEFADSTVAAEVARFLCKSGHVILSGCCPIFLHYWIHNCLVDI